MTEGARKNSEKVLAKLGLAALLIDLLAVLIVFHIAFDLIGEHNIPDIRYVEFLIFPALLFAYLFACEVVLGCSTFGQTLCGLAVTDKNGRRLSLAMRLKRMGYKTLFLGIPALNLRRPPFYSRPDYAHLVSDLISRASRSTAGARQNLSVVVASGPYEGVYKKLDFSSTHLGSATFNIGRSADWSDLCLRKDTKISSRHCILRRKGMHMQVMDVGSSDAGSANGTFVDGKRIAPGIWVTLSDTHRLMVADTVLEIRT